MSRYNHFGQHKYERVSFSSIAIGGMFRCDFHLGGRRRADIICIKTGELAYIEKRSKKEHKAYSDDFTVSSYSELAKSLTPTPIT